MAEASTASGARASNRYLLYAPGSSSMAWIEAPAIAGFTERHKLVLAKQPALQAVADVEREIAAAEEFAGVLLQLEQGIPPRHVLRLAGRLLAAGRRVALYWPAEDAVEIVDKLRLASLWRHWVVYQLHSRLAARRVARAAAAASPQGGQAAIVAARGSLDKLGASIEAWRANLPEIEAAAREVAGARQGIADAKAAGGAAGLATALEASRDAVASLPTMLEGCRLAANRCAYAFDDVAKTAASRGLSHAIDAVALASRKATTLGAIEQLVNIRKEVEANLPGYREVARQARARARGGKSNGSKAPAPAVRDEDIAVLDRVSGSVIGYLEAFCTSAGELLTGHAEARVAALHQLSAIETAAREAEAAAVAAGPAMALTPGPAPPPTQIATRLRSTLGATARRVEPVAFGLTQPPTADKKLAGTGIYLRTDYWAPILSGGSYGHTCYQAKALARTSESFVALTANNFPLLDELGLRQVVVRPEGLDGSETSLLIASERYHDLLRPALAIVRPAFVFERACLGNFAAARICRELAIPYVVEYNGSEISMRRSFDGAGYQFEDIYLAAEDAAFRQASAISVVSDAVRDEVLQRGIDPAKVLVNWNAVDLDAYRALPAPERAALRAELGIAPDERVTCFIGTFGGWHGIDVLAAALPRILQDNPGAKALLIGDGQLKPRVSEAIAAAGLGSRVVDVGRVEQARGARLMAAADIFLSPHSTHMVDSRFFGSPTKLFEYMGYGVGIVASDLEQLGEIMAPSLKASALDAIGNVDKERGILCKPGDVDELVAATTRLVRDPVLAAALGANARAAAEAHYTWDRHVERLWRFIVERRL